MSTKHSAKAFIEKVMHPPVKVKKHTPFNEPWKKPKVRASETRKRTGCLPYERKGSLSHYL